MTSLQLVTLSNPSKGTSIQLKTSNASGTSYIPCLLSQALLSPSFLCPREKESVFIAHDHRKNSYRSLCDSVQIDKGLAHQTAKHFLESTQ